MAKTAMAKTAMVIGATGLIGRALVDQLLGQDEVHKVITLTRRPLVIEHDKFENHQIDFSQIEEHKDYFNQVDLFFSCLGTTKKKVGTIAKQRVVDLDYQYRAAKLALQAGVENYFLVSSSHASAHSLSPYLKMKGELEDKVIDLGFKYCVILQPSLLIGEREELRLAEWLGAKFMPILGHIPGLKSYRPITGMAVAAKMVAIALAHDNLTNDNLASENKKPSKVLAPVQYYRLDQIF